MLQENNKVVNQKIKKLVSFIATRQQVHYPEIMSFLQVSRKEVVKYLNIISKRLQNTDMKLVRKRNVGIYFEGDINQIYRVFQTSNEIALSTNNRQNLILLSLLLDNDDGVKLESICEKYYVSRSTLDRDIKELKKELDPTLKIIGTRKGLKIKGDEKEKRNQASKIINKYWMETFDNNVRKISIPMELRELVEESTIRMVQEILLKLTNSTNLVFTEFQYQSFFIHICIMIERIKQKKYLKEEPIKNEIILKETQLLCSYIEDAFHVKVPTSEEKYLNIHIIGVKKNIQGQITKDYFCKDNDLSNFLKDNLDNWDEQLIEDLTIHLDDAIYRAENNLQIFNPYTNQIFYLYPVATNEAIQLASKIASNYGLKFNNDEIAYIAIHIEAYDERIKQKKYKNQKIKIVVVCSTGLGTARIIVQHIRKYIKDDAVITRVVSVEELLSNSISEDIIVSTVPIQFVSVRVIVVDPIITSVEIKEIKQAVHVMKDRETKKEFLKLLSPETIFIGNLSSQKDVIKYLGNKLIELGYADPEIIGSINSREKMASTALAKLNIAIPHPEPDTVRKTNIAIYIPKHEIKWGKSKVNLIFLMSYKKADINILPFDDIYHGFNLMVSSDELRVKLLSSKTKQEAYKSIYQFLE